MYGLNGLDDEQIQQLLGGLTANSPPQSFQAQSPQLTQGLLGDSGQTQDIQNLIGSSTQAANQMAQPQASTGGMDVAQRQAMAQQQAMQSAAQQEQQQAQAGQLLGTIASMFIPGLKGLKFGKK